MLHTIDPTILFLKQEDLIKAGLLDMKQTLVTVEDTYKMMGKGLIKNPPKTHLGIPKDPDWDSFFNAMPVWIGGDINIGGIKWAAESKKNATTPGIPYGIDITILSDPETVLPFAIVDGTIITAMRTSGVGGLQAKYIAPKDTKTVTLIGAGVIGITMIMAVTAAIPTVEKIYLCDLDLEKAKAVAAEWGPKCNVEIEVSADSKACSLKSELTIAETTARKPFIDKSWAKPHSAIVCMSHEATTDLVEAADAILVDYIKQMMVFPSSSITQLVMEGKLAESDLVEMGAVALGTPIRTSEDQFIYANSTGLGALDIMVAYNLFLNAEKMGIGTKVKLWDKPIWE